MWKMRYDDYSEQGDGFYTMSVLPDEDKNSEATTYVVSWVDPVFRPTSSSVGNVTDTELRVHDVTLNEVRDDDKDANSWIRVDETANLPGVKSVSVPDTHRVYSISTNQSVLSGIEKDKITMANKDSSVQRDIDTNLIYGHQGSIFLTCLVRLLLIGHNVFATWRVTREYNEDTYWLLAVTNFFLLFEGVVVIIKNGGKEYSW